MDQAQAKEALLSLEVPAVDFTLIFSGKKSLVVNGLYKPATMEIVLHNRNFKNDNALMFTAIHEFAHHVAMTRGLVTSRRAHPVAFWALFHSLLEIAIEKKVYTDPFATDPELVAQGKAVLEILKEQMELQKKLGKALSGMRELCEKKGARYEDFIDRHARISRKEADAAIRSQLLLFDVGDPSPDVSNLVLSVRGDDDQVIAQGMAADGKSPAQIRAAVKQKKVIDPKEDPEEEDPEDEIERLEKKLVRLRSTTHALESEIEEVEQKLAELKGKTGLDKAV